MSRRIGAYVLFDHQHFEPEVTALIERVEDLSPVMRTIGYLAAEEGRQQAQGNPEWAPHAPATVERWGAHQLGVGEHGGFAPTIHPFYGKRNAGWKTRAPHAHLFSEGTEQYSIAGTKATVWKGASKAKAADTLSKATGTMRQPDRPFDYLSEGFQDRANDRIAAYVLFEITGD